MCSVWPCLPSPKSCVDVSIGDAAVEAPSVGTGEALGVHTLGGSGGFSPHTRDAQAVALALHPTREWRRVDRRGNRLESGAVPETVERSAHSPCSEMGWLEREPAKTPEPRQREEEEEHEQEYVHLKGHKDPRCLNDAAWTIIKEE
jgi:hypothetical protein